jgi:hypothetical protein
VQLNAILFVIVKDNLLRPAYSNGFTLSEREQWSSLYLICTLTKHTHMMHGLSVINGIWRTSPSFSHFATDPEIKGNFFSFQTFA